MTTTPSPAPLPASAGVIRPGDPGYDEARAAWNLTADLRPAAVMIARSAGDVLAAVALAAEQGLRIAPQSTGHLATALPGLADALLLKTAIGGVEVDPARRIARVGAGAIWQDVVEAAAPHGLAALAGSAPDVGVVGYTLGGGLSWLAREHGLACNHVQAIELVTADGQLIRCTASEHEQLFWALRGGGGNFGVVTHIELDLFPVAEVFTGMTVWPADQARELLAGWAAWAQTAPDAVTTSWRLVRLPPDPALPEALRDTPLVVLDGAATGPDAERLLAGVRGAGTPIMDTWQTTSPAALLHTHMDPPHPVPAISGTALLSQINPDTIDALLAVVDETQVAPLLVCELRQLGGQVGRYPIGAGATARIDAQFALFAVGAPMGGPEHAAAISERLQQLVTALVPWSTGQTYLSFAEQGGSAEPSFPPATLERLRAVRRAWDPAERFVASHRIPVA